MALSERLIIMIETRLIYVNCFNDGVDKIISDHHNDGRGWSSKPSSFLSSQFFDVKIKFGPVWSNFLFRERDLEYIYTLNAMIWCFNVICVVHLAEGCIGATSGNEMTKGKNFMNLVNRCVEFFTKSVS